jgi:predicted metal-dependent enzyme (double-stranded beta helix superfamily)
MQTKREMLEADETGKLPYARRVLHQTPDIEVLLLNWRPGIRTAPHDHGDATGLVIVLAGTLTETTWIWKEGTLQVASSRGTVTGDRLEITGAHIHDVVAHGPASTLHVYRPAITGMKVFDVAARRTWVVRDDCGAWLPRDTADVVRAYAWSER